MDNYKKEIFNLIEKSNDRAKMEALTDIWEKLKLQEECYKEDCINVVKPSFELAMAMISDQIDILEEKTYE